MKIGFIGCPSSGKTTTAAMAFAKLKENGITAEFIPEVARYYIAEKRLEAGLTPNQSLKLTDIDQAEIMLRQAEAEYTMSTVCGPSVVVISDTSALSAILYMSVPFRTNEIVKHLLEGLSYDVLFYCPPVPITAALDPNRLHSRDEALLVDSEIPEILKLAPQGANVVILNGTPDHRSAQVLAEIYKRFRF